MRSSGRTARRSADGAGNRALAGHRVRDRNAERFARARAARRSRADEMHAAADQQQRALAPRDASRAARSSVGRIGPAPCGRCRLARCVVDPEIRGVEIVRRRGRRPPAHRARPGPAVRRSRPRRRGAPAPGMRSIALDADQLLHGGPQDFDLPRLLRHVLPGVLAVGVADRARPCGDAGIERLDQRR